MMVQALDAGSAALADPGGDDPPRRLRLPRPRLRMRHSGRQGRAGCRRSRPAKLGRLFARGRHQPVEVKYDQDEDVYLLFAGLRG